MSRICFPFLTSLILTAAWRASLALAGAPVPTALSKKVQGDRAEGPTIRQTQPALAAQSVGGGPGSVALYVDFLGEFAAANHSLGFFYLDIDTSGDGVPDFHLVGPDDDLDGDGLANHADLDDDGDGVPDTEDKAGYDVAAGPAAGWAPLTGSAPAELFQNGPIAAAAGLHPGDYWQFVPNGLHEQNGASYVDASGAVWSGVFLVPGAYLYVDERDRNGALASDGVPDVLQSPFRSGKLAPFVLEKGGETLSMDGQPFPGLLGPWSSGDTGMTLFLLCDDDAGSAVSFHFNAFFPYRDMGAPIVADIYEGPDGQPDYDLYGTTDEADPAIPAALKVDDPQGVRLWRYRRLAGPVSDAREITYFLTVYWQSGGQGVNTYYSRAELNEQSPYYANYGRNGRTSGDRFGVDDGEPGVGTPTPDNWFPRFQNLTEHDATAQFAFGLSWSQVANAPVDGSAPIALDPADQAWVDRHENFNPSRRVINHLDMSDALAAMPLDATALIWGRYGVDLADFDNRQVPRAANGRLDHFNLWSVGAGYVMTWEDLFGGGNRSYCDAVFFTNRPPLVEE